MNYESAGVNVREADALVDWLKARTASTLKSAGISRGIGPYAAVVNLGKEQLALTCDGVGTKTSFAIAQGDLAGLGQDLFAMNANDLICVGAEPKLFLDYYACGKLERNVATTILQGLIDQCTKYEVALVGGETAEMPGVYQPGDIDLAGFCVGLTNGRTFQEISEPGVFAVGIPSHGPHSNGFSLIRKIAENNPFSTEMFKWAVRPTRLYIKEALQCWDQGWTSACAHITGGGILNVSRILKNVGIEFSHWPVEQNFKRLQQLGKVSTRDAFETWNMGIGFIILTSNPEWVLSNVDGVLLGQTIAQKKIIVNYDGIRESWDI